MAEKSKKQQRLRRRRQQQRNGVRALPLIILCAVLMGLVIGAIFFRIGKVKVTGSTRYTDEEILAASGIQVGGNLFLIRTSAGASAIKAAFPYVESASIRRRFPSTVEITIREAEPAACIETEDACWLVSEAGRLLEELPLAAGRKYLRLIGITLTEPEAGKDVQGAEGEERSVRLMNEVLAALREAELSSDVGWLDVSQTGNVKFSYLRRFVVRLGTSADLADKLAEAVATARELDEDARGTLDVSVPGTVRYLPEEES